jgi:RsiW-degrading membrane proteinase PrsW (M82 family)
MDFLIRVIVSLVPVVLFLLTLNYLDSFQLVRPRNLATALLIGVIVAIVSLGINEAIMHATGWKRTTITRYVAPPIEEMLKAVWVAWLIARRRVGFMVDSAIVGFAVGAGFALVENVYYIRMLESHNIVVWIVRGLGTAVMHGGMTAIYGIITRTLVDRSNGRWTSYLPALAIVIFVHSLFNHFLLSPVVSTILLHLILPVILIAAFWESERITRRWLGRQMDVDAELLEIMNSGTMSDSRIGRYVGDLQRQFEPAIVVDMLCYLRIRTELAISAKGVLMMKEAGFKPALPDDTREKFAELKLLEKNIGVTGRLAMKPLLHQSTHDLWQLHQLDS